MAASVSQPPFFLQTGFLEVGFPAACRMSPLYGFYPAACLRHA